jgi:hypothetical protein
MNSIKDRSEQELLENFISHINKKLKILLSEKNHFNRRGIKRAISIDIDDFIRKNKPDKKFKIWADNIIRQMNS